MSNAQHHILFIYVTSCSYCNVREYACGNHYAHHCCAHEQCSSHCKGNQKHRIRIVVDLQFDRCYHCKPSQKCCNFTHSCQLGLAYLESFPCQIVRAFSYTTVGAGTGLRICTNRRCRVGHHLFFGKVRKSNVIQFIRTPVVVKTSIVRVDI